eukprot:TRINITY_DN3185_c0_g1_i1.p1 TRINITY_DN3185_c0_g1~~TRINITY_DN3185_c0_g1_i1.p1  ORF type:complete len:157 (-),score=25.06 TRINITY_DN3185_c0_g1_i1:180-650(-)
MIGALRRSIPGSPDSCLKATLQHIVRVASRYVQEDLRFAPAVYNAVVYDAINVARLSPADFINMSSRTLNAVHAAIRPVVLDEIGAVIMAHQDTLVHDHLSSLRDIDVLSLLSHWANGIQIDHIPGVDSALADVQMLEDTLYGLIQSLAYSESTSP